VLAHELAHVRQQNEGAVSMLPQEDMQLEVDPDPAPEHEAKNRPPKNTSRDGESVEQSTPEFEDRW